MRFHRHIDIDTDTIAQIIRCGKRMTTRMAQRTKRNDGKEEEEDMRRPWLGATAGALNGSTFGSVALPVDEMKHSRIPSMDENFLLVRKGINDHLIAGS